MAATEDRRETDSEIEIKPVYTEEDVQGPELEPPGEYPFTRGPYKDMYRGRPWTIVSTRASGRPSRPTSASAISSSGADRSLGGVRPPDSARLRLRRPTGGRRGERTGVAIDSIADMELLFDGIPLGEVSTSMTINAPAALLLLLYELVAEQQGVSGAELRGAVQNDVLKEYCARGNYIFPPKPMRSRLISSPTATSGCRVFSTISISGYHIREAGATAVQELAFTLANGIAYAGARSRPASHRTSSASGSRSSSAQPLLPGDREVPGGMTVGGSCATASAPRIRGRSPFASTPRPAAPR